MLLRELFEAPGKTAALAFGRLNPPTIGHAKLVDAITAQDGDHYLFLSQTQRPKTDPLDFATKMKLAKQFFPSINIGHQAVRTPVQALEQLQSLGYTDVIFIAGSDRVDGFQKLFDTYNGQPDKTGKVPFKFNSIRVVSAGERDPDADGAEGMSASKMRAAAAAGDLESFAQGAPDKKLAKTMYDAVRKGMGVKDEQPVEESNPFTDARMNAIKAGKSTFTVGGKTYKVTGDTSDEENAVSEKAPPGREKQVKALKKKFDDPGAPYAIAWAQHNKRGKPKKEQLDIDGMLDEILGFATKRPKTNTVKRRPPEPEQDSVQDKIKQRRALASKVGTDKAFRHDSLKGK